MTNLIVDVRSEDRADAKLYLTAYRYDDGRARVLPAPLEVPALLLIATARMVRRTDGWRMAEQTMQREFVRPQAQRLSDR